MEKYRLQHFMRDRNILAIKFANFSPDYVPGDFYVRAILGTTNPVAYNKANGQKNIYTQPYTLAQARQFIINWKNFDEVHDCMGLSLEDEYRYVDFEKAIHFRTISSSSTNVATKTIDATAIRRKAWVEDTYHLLSAVWGEEKAGLKLAEYRLPAELLDELAPWQRK